MLSTVRNFVMDWWYRLITADCGTHGQGGRRRLVQLPADWES